MAKTRQFLGPEIVKLFLSSGPKNYQKGEISGVRNSQKDLKNLYDRDPVLKINMNSSIIMCKIIVIDINSE